MRDPKRIPKIIEKIYKLWMANPDMRFSQLFINILNLSSHPHIFYIEDDKFEEKIEAFEKRFDNDGTD